MTKVCAGRAPELSSKRAGLPPALTALVRAMLAPEPARRPQSAALLAGEFAQLASGPGGADTGFPAAEQPPREKSGRVAGSEESVVSVMLISRGRRAKHEDDFFLAEIRRLAGRFTCVMDRLIDRTVLVTAAAAPTAEEQAIRLASLALALREFEPAAKSAIATGRTTLLGQLPVGPLMERLPLLMNGQVAGTIRLDEATRRLLPPAFRVAGTPAPLLLSGAPAPDAERQCEAAGAVPAPAAGHPEPRPRHPSVTDG
jgi:hypothetical protein